MKKLSILILSVIFAFAPMTAFAEELSTEEADAQEIVTDSTQSVTSVGQNFNLELGDVINVDQDYGYGIYFGGTVTVSGTYNSGLIIVGDYVIIDGAKVNGPLTIYASKKIELKNSARIVKLNHNQGAEVVSEDGVLVNESSAYTIGAYNFGNKLSKGLRGLATSIIILLIFVLFNKRFSTKMSEKIENYNFSEVMMDSLKGLAVIVGVSILSIVSLFTVVGASVGLVALIICLCVFYLSKVVFAIFLGRKLFKKQNTIISTIIVLVILMVVGLIPRLGTVITLLAMLVGFGLSLRLLPERILKKKVEKKEIKKVAKKASK